MGLKVVDVSVLINANTSSQNPVTAGQDQKMSEIFQGNSHTSSTLVDETSSFYVVYRGEVIPMLNLQLNEMVLQGN